MENDSPTNDGQAARQKRKARLDFVFALLSLLVCLTIPLSALIGSQGSFGKLSDFPEYYSAAKMIIQKRGAEIYELDKLFELQHQDFPSMEGRGIGYYIPPFATPLLSPLGLLAPAQSYLLFIGSAVLSLIGSLVLLTKHFRLSASGSMWLATAICATSPAFESLKIAQLAPFLLLSFAAFLFFHGRKNDLAAGASLGILLLKPQELLPILIYLLFARKFKLLLSFAGFATFLGLLSLLMIDGLHGYTNYFALLKDSANNTQFMQPELGATLRGQLLRFADLDGSVVNSLSLCFLVVVTALIAKAGFKFGKTAEFESGLLKLALPLGLVSALHCHDYDLLLLFPWVLSMIKKLEKSILAQSAQVSTALLFSCLSIPLYVPIHYDHLMRFKQTLNPIFLFLALSSILSALNFQKQAENKPKLEETSYI